jgi:hypothetical protein
VILYSANHKSGIIEHRDLVSFCTVVFCLRGNEGVLTLTLKNNEPYNVCLKSNDFIVFGRIDHCVQVVQMTESRIIILF